MIMSYNYEFSNEFRRNLKKIQKGDPKRIKQISEIVKLIINDPFDQRLHKEKLEGHKKNRYIRYQVGMKYRIQIEIVIKEKYIEFLKVDRRENFYS